MEKFPWVFLEKRESLFIIVSRVLLAEELVGGSGDVSDERLGDAAGARSQGRRCNYRPHGHVRRESKSKISSAESKNTKPKTSSQNVSERHRATLDAPGQHEGEERRRSNVPSSALLCRQRIKTNDDPKKKKKLV